MVRKYRIEVAINFARRIYFSIPRKPASVSLDHAQRRRIELIGALEPLAGFFLIPGEIENHASVQILEDRVPVGAGQAVDGRYRTLAVAGAIGAPRGQQRRGQIGDRSAP